MTYVLHVECRRWIRDWLICGKSCACLFALEKPGQPSSSYIFRNYSRILLDSIFSSMVLQSNKWSS